MEKEEGNKKMKTPENYLTDRFINPQTQDWFKPVCEIIKQYADDKIDERVLSHTEELNNTKDYYESRISDLEERLRQANAARFWT